MKGTKEEHTLNVDSKGLFEMINTLHNGREYRLRNTVQWIRDSIETVVEDTIRWLHSRAKIAEALTKWSTEMNKTLRNIIYTGWLILPEHDSMEKNPKTGNGF